MFVCIAGGGRTGSRLAYLLQREGHNVRVIEGRSELLNRLHHELPTEAIYHGDPCNPQHLENAGLGQANVLVACTGDDAVNLVVCYLGRTLFHVPRIIARVNNPHNAWLFNEKFHVDVALSQADILAHLIQEEMSLGDMMTLLKLRRGRYSLVEEKVPPGAQAIGIPLKDLGLPEECIIAAIIRHGKVCLPRGTTTFEVGDEVLAITSPEAAAKLAAMLRPAQNPSNHEPNR
ncbi:MAG: TrkA family potassium uptake protein [Anaerolineales bacterium]